MKLETTQNYITLYEFYARTESMLALVAYLETEIDYPSMLATHSHEDLILHTSNSNWFMRILPAVDLGAPKDTLYEIHCHLSKPWSHAVAYATNQEDVGKIIRFAIDNEIQIPASS